MYNYLVILILLLSLSACGGSKKSSLNDNPDTPTPDPILTSAVWTGSVNTTDKGLAITRSGDAAWFLLMDGSYTPQTLAIFVNAPEGVDMDIAGTLYPLTPGTGSPGVLSGTLTGESLEATIDGATYQVAMTANSTYDNPAEITSAVGSWQADYGDEGTVTMTVAATGDFTVVRANNPGCTFGGSLIADPDIGIFTLVFDEAPCGGERLEGLGLIAPISTQERIYLLLTTMDDQKAAVFMGVRR